MEILLHSSDREVVQREYHQLISDLEAIACDQVEFSTAECSAEQPGKSSKGDVATITGVLIAAVGAGGALTVALGKNGFLTRLAHVLESCLCRKVDITIKDKSGRAVIVRGDAKGIERILTNVFTTEEKA